MSWTLLFLILTLGQMIHGALAGPWGPESDPEVMSPHPRRRFVQLPLHGEAFASERFWSGDHWANYKGSINFRWYARQKSGFGYRSPGLEEARRMSIPLLAELSPAEKYDLLMGHYDYPLRSAVEAVADPKALVWEGICHGWAPASMNHSEPRPRLLRNPDGVDVPFGADDIKALLSYYYGFVHRVSDTFQLGKRCFDRGPRAANPDCHEDLNAGAFHIVLANRIGIGQEGFIADLQRFEEVWNHPITAYQTVVLKRLDRSLTVRTKLTFVEGSGHDWHPVLETEKQVTKTISFSYVLELDEAGEISGGTWLSRERPDFLWLMNRARRFSAPLESLGILLEDE